MSLKFPKRYIYCCAVQNLYNLYIVYCGAVQNLTLPGYMFIQANQTNIDIIVKTLLYTLDSSAVGKRAGKLALSIYLNYRRTVLQQLSTHFATLDQPFNWCVMSMLLLKCTSRTLPQISNCYCHQATKLGALISTAPA